MDIQHILCEIKKNGHPWYFEFEGVLLKGKKVKTSNYEVLSYSRHLKMS